MTDSIIVAGFWFVVGIAFVLFILEITGYPERQFNKGLATAVACAPGMYLEDLDHGWVLCIGGANETWRIKP